MRRHWRIAYVSVDTGDMISINHEESPFWSPRRAYLAATKQAAKGGFRIVVFESIKLSSEVLFIRADEIPEITKAEVQDAEFCETRKWKFQ